MAGPLPTEAVYYWRVSAIKNDYGESDWSDVWSFITQPPYGNIFVGVRGITDPDDDFDGIDNVWEYNNLSKISKNYKTLFVRPKQESGRTYTYWDGFIKLFPDSRPERYGFADIPALTNAGIEVVVIGPTCCSDPNNPTPATCTSIPVGAGYPPYTYTGSGFQCHLYKPFDDFNYDPGKDASHPNCDILEIINKDPAVSCSAGSQAYGHTFFSTTALVWSWDTKGYTPSAAGAHGYKIPQIYPFPLENYFKEGAYSADIKPGSGPQTPSCVSGCTYKSPLNLNATNYITGLPDATVEFDPITFDNTGHIVSMLTQPPLPTTGYDRDTVRRRTIAHELGHALLAGFDSDHCADPSCLMYQSMVNWEMQNFGPGVCVHSPGGSKDIRSNGIIHNSLHGIVASSAAPTYASPANGAATVTANPTLSWNASTGATSYGLQVSTDSTFATTLLNQSTITSTSLGLSGLTGNTTFYWRVNATNAGGTSDWSQSQVWQFTTVPGAPTLTGPANQTSTAIAIPVNFTWTAPAGGAATYSLQFVSTTSGTSTPNWTNATTLSNITTTSQSVGTGTNGLSSGKFYAWRVIAVNSGGGQSAASSFRRFKATNVAP